MAKLSDLEGRDVISVNDGRLLGNIADVEIDITSGCIEAVIVPGPGRVMGLFGQKTEFRIPWQNIKKIGPDVILVDMTV
ncbi:MAG TPA: YlmC/YmxH family sporulation protein [Firmicutes bacterium]|nr:YlmC/YmxH family sporulation protein [Bacillota bacterium]